MKSHNINKTLTLNPNLNTTNNVTITIYNAISPDAYIFIPQLLTNPSQLFSREKEILINLCLQANPDDLTKLEGFVMEIIDSCFSCVNNIQYGSALGEMIADADALVVFMGGVQKNQKKEVFSVLKKELEKIRSRRILVTIGDMSDGSVIVNSILRNEYNQNSFVCTSQNTNLNGQGIGKKVQGRGKYIYLTNIILNHFRQIFTPENTIDQIKSPLLTLTLDNLEIPATIIDPCLLNLFDPFPELSPPSSHLKALEVADLKCHFVDLLEERYRLMQELGLIEKIMSKL